VGTETGTGTGLGTGSGATADADAMDGPCDPDRVISYQSSVISSAPRFTN